MISGDSIREGSARVELPEDYYLNNFCTLVQFVLSNYSELLVQERVFFQTFQTLSTDAQKLYVRMLLRKGNLFRSDKLNYVEISSISGAAEELNAADFIELNQAYDVSAFLPLFTKAELLSACQAQNLAEIPELKRAKIGHLHQLLQTHVSYDLIAEELRLITDIFELKHRDKFDVLNLCFFGNLHQSLTDFVLRDLGLYQYEAYSLDRQCLPFYSKQQIEAHLNFYRLAEKYEEIDKSIADPLCSIVSELPVSIADDPALERRTTRLKLTVARQLERIGEQAKALEYYKQCTKPPARERRARILLSQGDHRGVFELCEEILGKPYCEDEQEFAESFAYRLYRKHPVESDLEWEKPLVYQPPETLIHFSSPNGGVEQQVADHLGLEGECYFVENTLINALLGLLIWDIVFYPIPGAFYNPFQHAPSDFKGAEFYSLRRSLIDKRLKSLETEEYKHLICQYWQDKQGVSNPFVFWQALDEASLMRALERIPAQDLLVMFKRILSDVTINRSGLPDLIFFPEGGGYKLIEVKGPGDSLQKNQRRWLKVFSVHNIPHEVVYVRYQA